MNITPAQSSNITKLYREAISGKKEIETTLDKTQSTLFDTWRTHAVTQLYIKVLEDKRDALLVRAMSVMGQGSVDLLCQANLLTKILSETIYTGELI